MSGAKSAAMEHGATAVETAAVKRRTSTMEATAAVKTASAMASPAAMTATAAADFGRRPGVYRCRHRARTDQRQRFRALVGCERQHYHRSRRKAQRTRQGADQPAPGIWNFHHA
jgi:hypothetical protein